MWTFPMNTQIDIDNRRININIKATNDGVDDDPWHAEGEDANTDEDIEEPLAPRGEVRGVTHVDISRYWYVVGRYIMQSCTFCAVHTGLN